jgi:hypothetical protein
MQRGQYSPPSGGYPQELPNQWRLPDGIWQNGLQLLNDVQLTELGWIGPIEFPDINYLTHESIWNETTRSFDIIQRDVPLPEPEQIPEPLRSVDYKRFWDNLLESTVYTSLKESASTNLALNTTCTEFIILLADAKFGEPKETLIQTSINQIFTSSVFTAEELIEVQSLFSITGLDQVYTLQ